MITKTVSLYITIWNLHTLFYTLRMIYYYALTLPSINNKIPVNFPENFFSLIKICQRAIFHESQPVRRE